MTITVANHTTTYADEVFVQTGTVFVVTCEFAYLFSVILFLECDKFNQQSQQVTIGQQDTGTKVVHFG